MHEYTQSNVLKVVQFLFKDQDVVISNSVSTAIYEMCYGVSSSHFGTYGRGLDAFKKLRGFLHRDI